MEYAIGWRRQERGRAGFQRSKQKGRVVWVGDGETSVLERGRAGAEGGSVGAAGEGWRGGYLGGGCGRGNHGSRWCRWWRPDWEKQIAALGEQALVVAGGEASAAEGGRGGTGIRSD